MIVIKLKDVAVKVAGKFRPHQNYTLGLWSCYGVDENSTMNEIVEVVKSNYSDRIKLCTQSKIEVEKEGKQINVP